MKKFENISITGRYIYGYLCLISSINGKPLPEELNSILCEFTITNRKDLWHEKAEEVLPSIVLDLNNDEDYYEYISIDVINRLRKFYDNQPVEFSHIVEALINMGIANFMGNLILRSP